MASGATYLRPFVRDGGDGGLTLSLPDSHLEAIVALATSDPQMRFRGEGIITLGMVRALGTPAQQERALATLKALAGSKDAAISALATWTLANRPTKETIAQTLAPVPK